MALPTSDFSDPDHTFYGVQDLILSVAYFIIDLPRTFNDFFRLDVDTLGAHIRDLTIIFVRISLYFFIAGIQFRQILLVFNRMQSVGKFRTALKTLTKQS
jgi:hypothetical protein